MSTARLRAAVGTFFNLFCAAALGAALLLASGCTVPITSRPPARPGGSATVYPPGAAIPDLSGLPVSMTPDQRDAAATTVADAFVAVRTGNQEVDNAALVKIIAANGAFADVGISPDKSVWARFDDGRPVTWVSEAPAPAEPSAPKLNQLRSLGGRPVPAGETAVLIGMDGVGAYGPQDSGTALKDAGYKPVLLRGSTSELATSVVNAGVLYFSTHGNAGVDIVGKTMYTLATIDAATPENAQVPGSPGYYDLYNSGQLSMMMVTPTAGNPVKKRWAITPTFILAHWSLAANPLVVIDGCALFADANQSKDFIANVTRVTDKGNATVLGWDGAIGTCERSPQRNPA